MHDDNVILGLNLQDWLYFQEYQERETEAFKDVSPGSTLNQIGVFDTEFADRGVMHWLSAEKATAESLFRRPFWNA